MKNIFKFFVFLFCLSLIPPLSLATPPHPFTQIERDPQLFSQLEQLVYATIKRNFGKPAEFPQLKETLWNQNVPIFVTAKKSGRILGCMGSLQAQQSNLVEEIKVNLQKAFNQDPRHPPIAWEEIPGMEIYLTSVGKPEAVPNLAFIHPTREGVLIKKGRREAVILAGETKTQAYLEKFARAKAGLKPGESFQVFRLPSRTLRITLSPLAD